MEYFAPQVDFSSLQTIQDQFAWFPVLVAVLLTLGATVILGAAIWCMYNGHGSFTGGVQWINWGFSLNIQCTD